MLRHFIKQVAEICVANQLAHFLYWWDFFSFHISDQRKEAKERRLFRMIFDLVFFK